MFSNNRKPMTKHSASEVLDTQARAIDRVIKGMQIQVLQNADQVEILINEILAKFPVEKGKAGEMKFLIEHLIKIPVRRNVGLLKNIRKTIDHINK